MKIPAIIHVGAQEIRIVRRPAAEIDSDCNGGWTMWEQNTLVLANDMPEDREAVTFLHEIIHFGNIYLTEEQVTWLSEMLLAVMRVNNLDFLSLFNGNMTKRT